MRVTGRVDEVIRRLTAGRRLRITVLGQREEAIALLRGLPSIQQVDVQNGDLLSAFTGDEATAAAILQALIAAGIKVSSFSQLEGGLEDAFLKATSEDIG
jgi:ABC-2 type transport system ATP-binding protein